MKSSLFFLYISLVITGVWFMGSGCANVGSPTGGPKDTIPPQVVIMYPKAGSLNVKNDLIRLEFNEYVNLKDFQSQLIITPRTDSKYKTKVNKNVVELQFDKPFNDSTTYTFNFREGIVDLTEGNAAKNVYLAFSTGSFLDSLKIRGNVETALTGKVLEGTTIALYNARDTATVIRDKPLYFTKTDKEGNYELRNLKKGRYLLYAFDDKNKNLTLQSKSESYGFWPDTLQLTSSLDSVNIKTFSVNAEKPVINSARPVAAYFEINFNKPMQQYKIQAGADTSISSNFIDGNKRVRIYPFPLQDSLSATITATDSLEQEVNQTLYIRFEESKRAKAPFTVNILPKQGALQTKDARVTLQFTKPVASINPDSIRFQYDSLNWEFVRPENLQLNAQRDQLIITKRISPPKQAEETIAADASAQALATGGASLQERTIELIIPKGSFISVESDTAENQTVRYKILDEKQTGIISGSLVTTANNFIVQLLRASSFEVAAEQRNAKQYTFRQVEPGEYLIRVITDQNNNKQWDPGNIFKLKAPEPVFIYPQPITIKANWEIQNPEILL